MAAKGTELMSELSEKLFVCGVCHLEFELEGRVPRLLPCFHSFCEVCLDKLKWEEKFACPSCRRPLPSDGEFPVDVTRMTLVGSKRSLLDVLHQGERSTSSREESGVPSCRESTCQVCLGAASPKMDVCSGQLAEAAEVAERSPWDLCEKHDGEKVRLFCSSCSKPVCAICALTLHKDGHQIVDLETILDKTRKEMESVCGQLGQVQQTFQMRVEQVEAGLEALEVSLGEAERHLQLLFSHIFTAALLRQTEMVEALRTRARKDRRVLEEQRAFFQSLVETSRITGDQIRAGLAPRLSLQTLTAQVQGTVADLLRKASVGAMPAPAYKIHKDIVCELRRLRDQVGMKLADEGTRKSNSRSSLKVTGYDSPGRCSRSPRETRSTDAGSCSGFGCSDGSLTYPSFQLDAAGCGCGCSLSEAACTLKNHSHQKGSPTPNAQSFRFRGTCGTEPVSVCTCYWQVTCRAKPSPSLKEECAFCEVGVATQGALQACDGGVITPTHHCALTAKLWIKNDNLVAFLRYRGCRLADVILGPATCHSPVVRTLGFLLDVDVSRVHVVDVSACRILCSSDVDMSGMLWPVVSVVNHARFVKADVSLTLQTGDKAHVTRELASVLEGVLVKARGTFS